MLAIGGVRLQTDEGLMNGLIWNGPDKRPDLSGPIVVLFVLPARVEWFEIHGPEKLSDRSIHW